MHHRLLVAQMKKYDTFIQECLTNGYGGLLGHYTLLNQRRLRQLKRHHKKVGVGFIASPNNLKRQLNRQIKWLFTNDAQAAAIAYNTIANS